MLRDRVLGARWLVYLCVTWSVAFTALPRLAAGAPIPPARADGAAGDLEAVRAALEQKVVRDRLAELGVSAAEAEAVLDRLSPAERSEVAARAQELDAGGSAGPAILAIAIIVGILVILVLELMGRRVISRPS